MQPPDGFVARRIGSGRVLICRPERIDAAVAAGLASPEGWNSLLADPRAERIGRGAIARVDLTGGSPIVLKKMRRGGMFASLRGDRFRGDRRLLRNLTVPLNAIRRGVSTPRPVVLLLQRHAGSYEAWLGVEEIPGTSNLGVRLALAGQREDGELRSAMYAVRKMHDAGVHHPDLNLANLLTRRDSAGWSAFIVDLDRARVSEGAVGFRGRQAALRRIERSYHKIFGHEGPLGRDGSDIWYRLYADGDAVLSTRLSRGRAGGRVSLAMHRIGWRLASKR